MNYTNLYMTRGDTFGFDILIEGLSSDLDEAYFSVRTDINDPAVYTFQKSLGDGIEKVETNFHENYWHGSKEKYYIKIYYNPKILTKEKYHELRKEIDVYG